MIAGALVAVVRPTSWDLPLFLHVLGATALFGAALAALVLGIAGLRSPGAAVLAGSSLLALIAALPAFVLMRVGGQWTYVREPYTGHGDPAWLGIGTAVSDGGLLLLLAAVGVAWSWRRRAAAGRAGWEPQALVGLVGSYVALLAVAWLAMSGKWG